MSRRRRWIAAGLVAVLALGTACSAGTEPADGTVRLTLLTHYGSEPLKGGLQKLVDRWNAGHRKIQVQTQSVQFDDLLSTIMVRQTSGRGADMINAYALWDGQMQGAPVLAQPPPAVAADIRAHYSTAAANLVTHNGRVLGYPTEVETYVLFYNKKLFAAAGLTHPPRTWAELRSDAVKLSTHDSKGNTTVEGISLLQSGDNQSVHPFLSLLNSAGGRFLGSDGHSAAFDSDQGRAALELESELARQKATDPSLDALKGFPSGKVAMAIQAGWWIGSLKNGMGADYGRQVATAPIPGPRAGQHGSLAYGFVIGVNNRCRHQAQAWQFLRWLNSHREANGASGMGTFLASQGIIPGRTADARALGVGAQDPNTAPIRAALGHAMTEPDFPAAEEGKTALHQDIMSVLTGQKSPGDALGDAAGQVEAAIASS